MSRRSCTPVLVSALFAAWGCLVAAGAVQARSDVAFECGGEVERRTWKLWDESGRALVAKAFVDDRLVAQGDTYGLYDFQGSVHNLLAMAARCGREERLLEFARIVSRAYEALVIVPAGGLGWICKGGRVCREGTPLHGTEVPLVSSQFMGLATRVATALAERRTAGAAADEFVAKTALVTVHHLNRWADDPKLLRLDERMRATPQSAADGQSKWFFTDIDLWIVTMYAELAGIQEARADLRDALARELSPTARERLGGLLKLLKARLTLEPVTSPRLKGARAAAGDLDRGFWRHYRDNRYAAYTDDEPPVSCGADKKSPRTLAKAERAAVVGSGGWDFSHARRLVHVIEALDRQRVATTKHYGLAADAIPAGLGPAFATALLVRVWNGDTERPLFANYWDGANGWYRAGHSSGGNCFEGYGPFKLSDAFALGGFASWAVHQPGIAPIGRRVYALAESTRDDDAAFVRTYYSGLGRDASGSIRTLAQLQFWPSLVGTTR